MTCASRRQRRRARRHLMACAGIVLITGGCGDSLAPNVPPSTAPRLLLVEPSAPTPGEAWSPTFDFSLSPGEFGNQEYPLLNRQEGPDSLLIQVTGGAWIGSQFIPASELIRSGGRSVYWRTPNNSVYRTGLALQFKQVTLLLPDSIFRYNLALPQALSQNKDTLWLLYGRETDLTAVSLTAVGNAYREYVCRYGATNCPAAASGAPFSDQGPSMAVSFRAYQTAAPALSVACSSVSGSTAIERGHEVRCVARVTPALPFRVVRQKAEAKKFRLQETPNVAVAPDSAYTWRGIAALDTEVEFEVEVAHGTGTKRLKKAARFTVTPRRWPDPQLRMPLTVHRTVDPGGQLTAYPANATLGLAGPIPADDSLNVAPVTKVDSGPNRGLGFLTNPYRGSGWIAYIHPGLDPVPAGLAPGKPGYLPEHEWHDDQNGAGSGSCTQSVFAVLVREVERHEGLTYSATSHHGVAVKAYTELKLAEQLEKTVTNSSVDGAIRYAVWNEWQKFHRPGGPYQRRQTRFDNTDRPRIVAALGCTLDFTRADK